MLKTFVILTSLFDPSSPRMQVALRQMVQDYATCAAYYNMKQSELGKKDPDVSIKSLGGAVNAQYEGHRIAELVGLPSDAFDNKHKAMTEELKKTLDIRGFPVVYLVYENFCSALRDNPGDAFIKRLPKPASPTAVQNSKDRA